MSTDLETRQEYELTHGTARYWHIELGLADDEEKDWREEGKEVVNRFRAEGSKSLMGREKKFNILWSNTETLKSSLVARMAKPDVRRRYRDRDDKAGREVSIILERALEYSADIHDDFNHIKAAVEDYLLPGRAVVWVTYEPVVIDVDGVETIGDQRCMLEYIHWEDYRESPAKRPEDVRWKARRHLWTRQEIDDRFPNAGDVPLNWTPDSDSESIEDAFKRAEVWEVWDKVERKRVFVVKGYHELVGEEDEYNLEKFYPTPDALVSVRTNESGVPVPEFRLYQDQADELDRITTRINRLIEGLKRRGVYDASVPELAKLADAGDNEFIPSENYASLAQGGGLQGSFQTEDLTSLATTLMGLYEQRDRLVQTIYEVTGISDVIRGSTDPGETATAQKLKGQFGSMRMKTRQDAVQKYIRDLMRIKAELIAENYEPHILQRMTGIKGADPAKKQQAQIMAMQMQQQGQPVPAEVTDLLSEPTWDDFLKIMRDDKARSYHIDIETDSTVFEDAEGEKKNRMEFVNNLGMFLQNSLPVVQAAPEMTNVVFEAMEFMVRGFKIGRGFEDVIEETKDKILEQQKQAESQPQQPDPAQMEAQAKQQSDQAKMQADQAKMQQDGQIKLKEMEAQAQDATAKDMLEQDKLTDTSSKWRTEAELKEREIVLKERIQEWNEREGAARLNIEAVKVDVDKEHRAQDHDLAVAGHHLRSNQPND
jgi:hypothetical protein